MELADAKFDLSYDDGEDFDITLDNGSVLKGCTWKPSGEPTFIYVFVHGLGVCVTFKKDFFPFILERGGVVFGCDHYGHGRSSGSPVSGTIDLMAEETVKVIQLAHSRYPNLPLIIHGHSMGGLCTIYTILTRYNEIKDIVKCAIAEAPWISPCPQRQLGTIERYGFKALNWAFPTMQISTGANPYSADMDQRFVTMAKASPLIYETITPQLYFSVEEKQAFIHEHPELWPAELPLFFVQGEADSMVDAKTSDKWVQKVLARDGMNVKYKLYPKGEHVMLKTPHRPEVARDLLEFIDEHRK
ncbi:Clan SC, family S33, methylesterase-like serine peptidase [Histomonas meleagridis]|uniref:Clan SC, family S33, methylesterase-like serine peptidase n=1 Tax=Histomonas meleagridis TaxID=135588 RepID=UPI003559BDE6|nr:Clan SC, family S33, methylesterase-like serine peptidase [Histomonas meleagridis]KAH0803761.1 Clan SC, family S33, methylesterase-like serine peptidase [Histomonas meleagridis]